MYPLQPRPFFFISFSVSPAQMSQKAKILCNILPSSFLVPSFPGTRRPLLGPDSREEMCKCNKSLLYCKGIQLLYLGQGQTTGDEPHIKSAL